MDYPGSVFETFDYDETGNRIQRVTTDYAYNDADQLTSATTGGVVTTYTNDNNGNMTGRGSDSFTYDHENRLTSATVGMNSFSATYDGDGLRATSDGTTWTWDAARGLPQVISDGSTTYVYGLDLISKTASGGARRYYAQDGLGTTVALSNTSGASVGTASYWGYGEQKTATGESAAPFEFAGEQRDASTGLYYLRARYYDPDAGRFITKDPWGGSTMAPGTLNPYPYVLGNPANLVDPSGRCVPGLYCPQPARKLRDAAVAIAETLTPLGEKADAALTDSGGVLWDGFGPPYTWEKAVQILDLVPIAEGCTALTRNVPACQEVEQSIDDAAYVAFLRQIMDSDCGKAQKEAAVAAAVASYFQGNARVPFQEASELAFYLVGSSLIDCPRPVANYEGDIVPHGGGGW